MLQREHPPTFLMFIWMLILLPLVVLQLLIPSILMNLILNIYTKASKLGNTNLVVYIESTKSPVLLDPKRFQFVPPYSSIRNSRANNDIIFGMRLVILI